MSRDNVTDTEVVTTLVAIVTAAGLSPGKATSLLRRAGTEFYALRPSLRTRMGSGFNESTAVPEAPAKSQPGETVVSDVEVDDLLSLPSAAPAAPSPLADLLRRLSDRVTSPFTSDGRPRMIAALKDDPLVGVLFSARFSVSGDHRIYKVNRKVTGRGASITRETEAVRVYEAGRPVAERRAFSVTWRGEMATGVVCMTAIHLPLGREFVVWLNKGTSFGDIVKRVYTVAPEGLICTRVEDVQ